MKHSGFKVTCFILILTAMAILPVFGDENTVNFESRVLETFDGDSGYVWKTQASKFTSTVDEEAYPKISLINSWPMAVFGANREGRDLKVLGVNGRFDRRGYNWVDVYPTTGEDEPFEIPMPGRVQYLDMWIWGSNLNYYVEAYIRDYRGVVHVLNLGDVNHNGWQNHRANVPNTVPQSKRVLPRLAALRFVKFRIWTRPTEYVGNFYIYFDQFKVLTDSFESIYDGDELADPARVDELWAGEQE